MTTQEYQEYIEKHGIRMTATKVDRNPNMADAMPAGSTHWMCTFTAGAKALLVYYSMGPALTGEPQIVQVLNCLADDAAGYEFAGGYEEWCADYGYGPGDRDPKRIYATLKREAGKLRVFLGDAAYDELLNDVDRNEVEKLG